MTNITFKTLSKISAIFATSVALTIPTVTASNAEITFDEIQSLNICAIDGGVVINSGELTSCLNPKTNEATECDNGRRGEPDACSTEPVPEDRITGGKHVKPTLKSGTMIMPPDTNTTVGTVTKPSGGKLEIRELKRN